MPTPDPHVVERFDDVDVTGQEAMLIAFLDRVDAAPDVGERRAPMTELLARAAAVQHLAAGARDGAGSPRASARSWT